MAPATCSSRGATDRFELEWIFLGGKDATLLRARVPSREVRLHSAATGRANFADMRDTRLVELLV